MVFQPRPESWTRIVKPLICLCRWRSAATQWVGEVRERVREKESKYCWVWGFSDEVKRWSLRHRRGGAIFRRTIELVRWERWGERKSEAAKDRENERVPENLEFSDEVRVVRHWRRGVKCRRTSVVGGWEREMSFGHSLRDLGGLRERGIWNFFCKWLDVFMWGAEII